MFKKVFGRVLISLVFLSSGACRQENGSQNIIQGVDVQTSLVSGDTFISLDAILKIGSLALPKMEVPIIHPQNQSRIGGLTLEPLQDGTSRVAINIDYTAIAHFIAHSGPQSDPPLGLSLPNGREIPQGLALGAESRIGIPVLENSRIYVGSTAQKENGKDIGKDIFIGVALGVPALDSVVRSLPSPLNLFLTSPFSAEIIATGGMYTSIEKSKNGIGIFVKKTGSNTASGFKMGTSEFEKLDPIARYKLDRLLNRHSTLRIK